MRRLVLFPLLAAIWLAAAGAQAQFPQYARPGSFSDSGENTKKRLEDGYAEARWSIGDLRLEPVLSIRDATYLDNVFGVADTEPQISDFTATVAAGLFGYLHFGPKVILSGYARPEYVWWQDLEALRTEHVNAGVGVFAFFNRMTVSVDAERTEEQTILNFESEVPVGQREDSAEVDFELEINRRVFLFGSASAAEISYEVPDVPERPRLFLSFLDRDEDVVRGGLDFHVTDSLSVGVGVESSDVAFAIDPELRSHTGTGVLLDVSFRGESVSVQASVVDRALDFVEGSPFVELDAVTGDGSASWTPTERSRLTVYAARGLVYSGEDAARAFINERRGASYRWRLRPRLSLTVFTEQGENDFASVDGTVDRFDEFEAIGASVRLPLWRNASLLVGMRESELTSNQPEFNRSTTAVLASLELGEDLTPW